MNLKDNKLLLIGGTLVVGTTIFILYNRTKKSAEVDFMLEKIAEFKTENKGDVNIIENLFKKDLSKVAPPQGAKFLNEVDSIKVAQELKDSIESWKGTDETKFYTALNKVKSVYDWQRVVFAYKGLTKRFLYKDMLQEWALRKGALSMLTTNEDESILFVDKLANYLKNLPTYRFK